MTSVNVTSIWTFMFILYHVALFMKCIKLTFVQIFAF